MPAQARFAKTQTDRHGIVNRRQKSPAIGHVAIKFF
jgi:hypothetical protein